MALQAGANSADEILAGDVRDRTQGKSRRAVPAKALETVIQGLRYSREVTHNIRQNGGVRELPSPEILARIIQQLAMVLFPTHYGRPELLDEAEIDALVERTLDEAVIQLTEQVRRDLAFSSDDTVFAIDSAGTIVRQFVAQLPVLRGALVEDLRAAYRGDPAATSFPEILLGYPGITAMIYYRLARALYLLGAVLSARLIGHISHSKTAIDIHPGATIGRSFFIDHGTGVVIGETAVIGDNVRIYQAVTLGARSFPADDNGALVKGVPRHPVIEDDVVIYAGATILGRITIGKGSVIGGNVWLTQSVPPGSTINQARAQGDLTADPSLAHQA
ncbi:MAG TPA: serine O-acetyltransferase EpsC [Rhizomicrobium sp.]|nr:serine O-acetyltransferase EpsC [Rhizomicrobium sp.]